VPSFEAGAVKWAGWGDGFAEVRVDEHAGGAFVTWYFDGGGTCVGVLASGRDEDFARGVELIRSARA
jgi:3-phenylpropionate/trans-cinnamate dioxygenase ferredoxin reductase component